MKINEAISAMLKERSTTARKLAFDLDVTPQTVSGYINGQVKNGVRQPVSIKVDNAVDIAAALGYTLAFVPTDKVPKGAFVIDERATPRRARTYHGVRRSEWGKTSE